MRKKVYANITLTLSLRVCSVTVYTYIESNKLYHMEFDTSIREVITPSKDAFSVRTAQTVQTQTYVADKAQRKWIAFDVEKQQRRFDAWSSML